jgi:glycogen synthase
VVITSSHGAGGRPPAAPWGRVYRSLSLYLPFDEPARLLRATRWRVGRRNAAEVRRLIALERPDLTFIWSQLRLTVGGARAAEAAATPVVYAFNDEHIGGYVPSPFALAPRALARYAADRWVFPGITTHGLGFSRVVCVSRAVKDALLAKGLPIAAAQVVHQGIPLDHFPPKPDIGSLASPGRLLYVGQLVPSKGVDTLIEAVHLLAVRSGTPPLRLSIVGDGPPYYTRGLRAQASAGPGQIDWLGRIPYADLPAVYRSHDILVFPSRGPEAFGLTHLEAMASGTPVISTTVGGHGELVKDGDNALAFEREHPHDLASQILRLVRDEPLRRGLAHRARAMVERDYNLDRYVATLEAVLRAATAPPSRPTPG